MDEVGDDGRGFMDQGWQDVSTGGCLARIKKVPGEHDGAMGCHDGIYDLQHKLGIDR